MLTLLEIIQEIRNNTISSIGLIDEEIGDAGAEGIAAALKTNRSVTSIDLWVNEIGAAGAQAIAETLKTNGSLTFISLYINNIGAAGAQAIAEALKTNSSLTSIDLSNNNLGDAGAQAIAEALKTNSSLRSSHLRDNNIGDAGAQAIAEALKTNGSLTSISLYSNNIGDAGAQTIAEALKTNSSLTSMNLSFNQIGDAGAIAIAEALKTNSSLTSIFLSGSKIGAAGAQAMTDIEKYLARNREIARFNSLINQFNYKALIDKENHDALNQQLASLEQTLEQSLDELKDYPEIQMKLTKKWHSLYISIYSYQGDVLSALAHYKEHPELEDEALLDLGDLVYKSSHEDFISLIGDKGFEFTAEDKNKAALALLGQAYQDEAAQELLIVIARKLLKEAQSSAAASQSAADLGVSLLIPEEKLALLLSKLPVPGRQDKPIFKEAMQNLLSKTAQELYEACQRQPLKAATEQAFGSSEFATLESLIRHPEQFPIKRSTLRQMPLIEEAFDLNALANAVSITKSTPFKQTGFFDKALSPLLAQVEKVKAANSTTKIKKALVAQIDEYLAFLGSLKTLKVRGSRRDSGFFTRLRHGFEDTHRIEALRAAIQGAGSAEDVINVAHEFFNDEKTNFHRNSLPSYLLDALSRLEGNPWSSIQADLKGRFDRVDVLNRFEEYSSRGYHQPG